MNSGIRRSGNRDHAYDEATALITRVRDLMRRTMHEKEITAWIEAVRVKHKAKRNFMQPMAKVTPAREWAGGSIPQ